MMSIAVRFAALLAFLALSNACADLDTLTAPTPTVAQNSTPPPTTNGPPPPFPALSRPARVYVGSADLYPPSGYSLGPLASRYVLYEDGTFALQFTSAKQTFFEYRGTYIEATLPTLPDALVTFKWEGWSAAGPWGATGSLNDRSLTVSYNVIMMLSDFVDGVYVRTQ
jgi:hypothetical protein